MFRLRRSDFVADQLLKLVEVLLGPEYSDEERRQLVVYGSQVFALSLKRLDRTSDMFYVVVTANGCSEAFLDRFNVRMCAETNRDERFGGFHLYRSEIMTDKGSVVVLR